MQHGRLGSLVAAALVLAWTLPAAAQDVPAAPRDAGWPHYGNDAGGTRYSSLAQIDRTNVAQLQVAWTYRTGALTVKTDNNRKAAFEATPILVAGRLYLTTPYDHVIALDPASGAKLWEYDPGLDLSRNFSEVTSRGVAAWRDTSAPPSQRCALRFLSARSTRACSRSTATAEALAAISAIAARST